MFFKFPFGENMTSFYTPLRNFCLFLSSFIIFGATGFAQNKVDLEIKAQTLSETVRGGETFSYMITVSNVGSAKATDVIFIQTEPKMTEFVSNAPSKGICEVDDKSSRVDRVLRCRLGDMEPGESIITAVELKIHDFGDISEKPDPNEKLPSLLPGIRSQSDSFNDSLGYVDVSAEEPEENKGNNEARISVQLLPSKNIPPRVKIITPKNETVITRSAKKPVRVTFMIKAFDPDGKIEKVLVNTQQFGISVEYPENRLIIEGKSYSIKEVEDNKEAFQKYFGGEAKRVAPDTYEFTLENPKYGLNNIFVHAIDDGGRDAGTSVRLTVKGNNSIEFTKPLKDSVIKPGSDVVIETLSKLNDGSAGKFELIGNWIYQPPVMKQISKTGNTYVHRYVWKNIPKGYYNLQIFLTEDNGAFTYSDGLFFKVTEKPVVKITSLKNGQIFKPGEEIPIELDAVDPDGRIKDVTVLVNGKYSRDFSWLTGGYNKSGRISFIQPGVYKISARAEDDMDVANESESFTIVVK